MDKKDLNTAAQKATAGFFTRAEDAKETGAESAKKAVVKKGFSFRGNEEDVRKWQNYAMAVKSTHAPAEKFRVDEIWCKAIEEYIENHPLDGKAKELFDQYMG